MDVGTLLRLRDAFQPLFITGPGNDAFLASIGIDSSKVFALDWWDTQSVGPVVVHAVPNQHFSGRGIFDRDGTLWTAFVLEGKTAGRAYFAGDTGYGGFFKTVAEKLGPLRLAILPIGAYKPAWFMEPVHMSPAQAVQAQLDLGAPSAVAIHYGTFQLADDAYGDPPKALLTALDGNSSAAA